MKKIIYLDNASTTPIYKKVKKKIISCFNFFGNYSSNNYLGNRTKFFLDSKIFELSNLIKCNSDNIIWTSCATEANNMVIYTILSMYKKFSVLCFSTEHKSIIECLNKFKKKIKIYYIKPDKNGFIIKKKIKNLIIKKKPKIIFCMYINNETGLINNISYVCKLCRRFSIYLHIDCSQIVGKIKFEINKIHASSLTFSAHKCYGPKGIGFLYINNKFKNFIKPMIIGGGQQNSFRAGTIPTHQIVGLCESFKKTIKDFDKNYNKIINMRKSIVKNLIDKKIKFKIIRGIGIPHIINICFKNVINEILILELGKIIVSKGSACSSNYGRSHVLKSMGFSNKYIDSSVRISLGNKNNINEIKKFNIKINEILNKLS